MDFSTILLIIILLFVAFVAYKIGKSIGEDKTEKKWQEQIHFHRTDAIERSRRTLAGNFSEQLAPFLPDFKYSPTECKFLGKPVDFIVFKGSDQKQIEEVIFVEVKSGESKLSNQEKNLKEAIQNKKVKWEEYRVPTDITSLNKKKNKIG